MKEVIKGIERETGSVVGWLQLYGSKNVESWGTQGGHARARECVCVCVFVFFL
jgi:hypothetical protein